MIFNDIYIIATTFRGWYKISRNIHKPDLITESLDGQLVSRPMLAVPPNVRHVIMEL